jgi:hypothetical protein
MLTWTADIDIEVRATKYGQQMNVLAIVCNSLVKKYFVESGNFPESATTASWEVEHTKTIVFAFASHIFRIGREL